MEGTDDVTGDSLNQRRDDTEDVIKKRLLNYKEKTIPLIDFYREKGMLYSLDAGDDIKEVWFHLKRKMENF